MSVKICIITTVHSPFDVRIFHKEAKSLVKFGYDVPLIAQNNRNEVVDRIKIIALPKPKNRSMRILGLTWRVFYLALHQHTDVYHFHDPEIIILGIILKILGKKIVYNVHEDYEKIFYGNINIALYLLLRLEIYIVFEEFLEKKNFKYL